jgi:hypothetical protein
MKISIQIAAWIIMLTFALSVKAQPLDYDDYYKTMATQSDENCYNKLMIYQKSDPFFANIYVQLGELSYHLLHKTDPLRDFENAMYWSHTGLLNLQVYTHYVKENEARSNRDFYMNLPIEKKEARITNLDIQNFVEKRVRQIESYRDSVILVYRNLERSKELYNSCISLYHQINNRHNNLNETLLKSDITLFKELNQLKSNFDSTLVYFNRYLELIKKFPVKDYNQQYTLKPIKTFRLDGLTNSNFLDNSFQIWNYGLWVDEFNALYDNDIQKLRQEIETIDKNFISFENKAVNHLIKPADASKPIFDEKFLYMLGKYDNNSLVRDLFTYKWKKQQFLAQWLDEQNSATDTIKGVMMRKARYYSSLVDAKTNADSALLQFKSSISNAKINRFSSFFHSYEGESGLTRFCDQQKDTLFQLLNGSFENLKNYIAFDTQNPMSVFASYGKDTIPIFKAPFNYKGNYKTSNFVKTSNNSNYITGQELIKGSMAPFISYADKTGKTKWLKKIEKPIKPDSVNYFIDSKVYSTNSGCFVVYTHKKTTLINTVVRFDSIGNEMSRFSIPVSLFPVYFDFDDINQKYLMAFKGQDTTQLSQLEPLTVSSIDSAGTTLWSASFELNGALANIVRTDNNFLIFANYRACNISGNIIVPNQTEIQWGSVIVTVSESGIIKNFFTINKKQSFHISHILKLSSNSICLIGFKKAPNATSGNLFFSLMQPNGKVVFTN